MENEIKVFSSNITRLQVEQKNYLYELVNIVPAIPVSIINKAYNSSCEFCPKIDKHYVPKRKSKLKVKTVRDIRNMYEQYVYSYLNDDIEKQQNILLKKIRRGSSRDENTKLLAKNILKSDNPLSRSAWQMLVNINPDKHDHPTQFVSWNGRTVQVNGSKGGKNKFICNYDLANNRPPVANINMISKIKVNKKNKLLQNSLNVKFKPGPLRRKKHLDDSYQKYHFGDTELISLPKPGLDIQPTYGVSFESTITNFVNSFRDENGCISQRWAELAVTVLGKINDSKPIQLNKDRCITFDLNYKCDQRRILMRRDIENNYNNRSFPDNINIYEGLAEKKSNSKDEITSILNNILDSVEISLQQDEMYCTEEEPGEFTEEVPSNNCINMKDKIKKKYGELDRLAVTVIRLPDSPEKDISKLCGKSYCTLGCVCTSLNCSFNLKQHCGLVECMFECRCNFSKFKNIEALEHDCSNIIPGLLKLDREINSNLAKEEQKFHQTVIMAGEKSILLKSRKRNWKVSKKYGDNSMFLKNDEKPKKILTIIDVKLNCENIEPWCMIHNLYKCFCKGKFTDTSVSDTITNGTGNTETVTLENTSSESEAIVKNNDSNIKNVLRPRKRPESMGSEVINRNCYVSDSENTSMDLETENECSRTSVYRGRKFNDEYYKKTSKKILLMERNDFVLRKKLMFILSRAEYEYSSKESTDKPSSNTGNETSVHAEKINKIDHYNVGVIPKRLLTQTELVPWFASNYKLYQQRKRQGKITLEAPQLGKLALYAWDFVLNRYKEQKNLFLVSTQKPFRLFMAVHTKHPYFDKCININDIRFADLHKYPITVKNLLTNATDLKDHFCILAGSTFYWEIIGSVSKINEKEENKSEDKEHTEKEPLVSCNNAPVYEDNEWVIEQIDQSNDLITSTEFVNRDLKESESNMHELEVNSDSSKWFVMTVENDFSEIHFKKRGFFIKNTSIVQAINVSRMSGKTVRLSTQTCVDKNNGPQFGLYAIPNLNEYCVFVGPYETDEPLGITTVKTILDIKKRYRTRGVWITTNKVDNLKVIDNPLSFMLLEKVKNKEMIPLEGDVCLNANTGENIHLPLETDSDKDKLGEKMLQSTANETSPIKVIKPIKIRKTNGFYHFARNSFLNTISLQKTKNSDHTAASTLNQSSTSRKELTHVNSILLNNHLGTLNKSTGISDNALSNEAVEGLRKTVSNIKKPVAEIAPQIKLTTVNSVSPKDYNETKNKKLGMFVLKPEEINRKLFEKDTKSNVDSCEIDIDDCNETSNRLDKIDLDIENFLANSAVCDAPNDDVYIISDDEQNENIVTNKTCKDVWIQCVNIDDFAWIRGRRNFENLLSFEFPGFNYSEYYIEEDAFSKINQVLSRKVYIPKHIKLEWQVVDSEDELKSKNNMLKSEHLGQHFIFTKYGLQNTLELRTKDNTQTKIYPKNIKTYSKHVSRSKKKVAPPDSEMASGIITELEQTSKILEDESNVLWNETVTKKSELIEKLSDIPNGLRSEMTETLKSIMLMTDK